MLYVVNFCIFYFLNDHTGICKITVNLYGVKIKGYMLWSKVKNYGICIHFDI